MLNWSHTARLTSELSATTTPLLWFNYPTGVTSPTPYAFAHNPPDRNSAPPCICVSHTPVPYLHFHEHLYPTYSMPCDFLLHLHSTSKYIYYSLPSNCGVHYHQLDYIIHLPLALYQSFICLSSPLLTRYLIL